MRDPDAAFVAALTAATSGGIAPRKFVWIVAKDRDTGAPFEYGFCTMDDSVEVQVIDGETGTLTARAYHGVGSALKVSPIPLVADLTEQTVTVELSQIDDDVQALVRGYDVRGAIVEIHDGLLSATTGYLVSDPEIAFLGIVDKAPIDTPAAGGEGSITLEIVSSAIRMLTRTNPKKRSYEGQRRRSDDQWGIYSNTAGQWVVPWGEKDAGATSAPNSSGRGG